MVTKPQRAGTSLSNCNFYTQAGVSAETAAAIAALAEAARANAVAIDRIASALAPAEKMAAVMIENPKV